MVYFFLYQEFLADYGMIWVGDDHAESDEDTPRQFPEGRRSHQGVWKPGKKFLSPCRIATIEDKQNSWYVRGLCICTLIIGNQHIGQLL